MRNDESRCDMAGVNESTPHCYLVNVLISVKDCQMKVDVVAVRWLRDHGTASGISSNRIDDG
jgi:hypothetical protein